jgi:tetratricopeptide (TPR) repeat protein
MRLSSAKLLDKILRTPGRDAQLAVARSAGGDKVQLVHHLSYALDVLSTDRLDVLDAIAAIGGAAGLPIARAAKAAKAAHEGRADRVAHHLERFLKEIDRNPLAGQHLMMLGELLYLVGDWPDAAVGYAGALRHGVPDEADVIRLRLAECQRSSGEFAAALSTIIPGTEHPRHATPVAAVARMSFLRGLLHEDLGQFEYGAAWFKRAAGLAAAAGAGSTIAWPGH